MPGVTAAAVLLTAMALASACGGMGAQDAGSLRNPSALNEQAPPMFRAAFNTSKGAFVVEVHREWAPLGADRF
jgi:hypothetical protein